MNPTLNSTSFEQELHFFFPFAVFELLVGSIHERLQDIVRFLLRASSLPDHVVEDILDLPVSFVPLPNDDKTSQIILQSVLAPQKNKKKPTPVLYFMKTFRNNIL